MKKLLNFKKFILILLFITFSYLNIFSIEILSPEKIKKGDIGIGKTVFEGTKIDTFKVKIMGILPKALGGQPLILARVDSKYLKEHNIKSILAGMSGSPVYIKGKLIGAIAYGWAFSNSKEPIAGITPITAMLKSFKQKNKKNLSKNSIIPINLKINGKTFTNLKIVNLNEKVKYENNNTLILKPLQTKLFISGISLSQNQLNLLKKYLPQFDITPLSASNTFSDKKIKNFKFEPGCAVGAYIVKGDINFYATGTLTYIDNNKILAFGHPFLFAGKSSYPLFGGKVIDVFNSLYDPFKLAVPVVDKGSIIYDGLYSIAGNLNKKPKTIEFNYYIKDKTYKEKKLFKVKIIDNDKTWIFALFSLMEALSNSQPHFSKSMLKLSYDFYFSNANKLHISDFYPTNSPQISPSLYLGSILRFLQNNDFKNLHITKVNTFIEIESTTKLAQLIGYKILNKDDITPGCNLKVRLYLKEFNAKTFYKDINIKLPQDLDGDIKLAIGGGAYYFKLLKKLRLYIDYPVNINQFISIINNLPNSNDIIILISKKSNSVLTNGYTFNNIPDIYANKINDSLKYVNINSVSKIEKRIKTNLFIDGFFVKKIKINISNNKNTNQDKKYYNIINKYKFQNYITTRNIKFKEIKDKKYTTINLLSNQDIINNSTFKDTAINEKGNLTLSMKIKKLQKFSKQIWQIYNIDKNILITTIFPATIYILKNNQFKKLFTTSSPIITAITSNKNNIYIATIDGYIYVLDKNYNYINKYLIKNTHIWDIKAFKNKVYIATGENKANLYILDNRKIKKVFKSNISNFISLCITKNNIYIGTSNLANIIVLNRKNYLIKNTYTFEGKSVNKIIKYKNDIYCSVTEPGKIFKIKKEKIYPIVYIKDNFINDFLIRNDKLLIATNNGKIIFLNNFKNKYIIYKDKDNLTSMLIPPNGGLLFSSSKGNLYKLYPEYVKKGIFISKIIKIEKPSIIKYLITNYNLYTGNIKIYLRYGNVYSPDKTWTKWQYIGNIDKFLIIDSKNFYKYLQLKIEINKNKSNLAPEIQNLTFFLKSFNNPPQLQIKAPAYLSNNSKLKIKYQDKENDPIYFELYYKNIKDKKWQFLKEDILTFSSQNKSKGTYNLDLKNKKLKDGKCKFKILYTDNLADFNFKSQIIESYVYTQKPIINVFKKKNYIIGYAKSQIPITYIAFSYNKKWIPIEFNYINNFEVKFKVLNVKNIKILVKDIAGNKTIYYNKNLIKHVKKGG